jgi:copper/silver efflux system protein
VLKGALRWKWTTLAVNLAIIPLMIPLMLRIGSEFMPPLYEGSLLYMPTAPPGLSATEATRMLQIQDRIIKEVPEVELVFGTAGRATTPTDNSPMGMVNTTILLKPREQWRPGMTFEGCRPSWTSAADPGLPQHLDAADPQPARHAVHRDQDAGRHQGARARTWR